VVCVRDDGKGLPQAGADEGGRFGVAGMRERVQAFGGSFVLSGAAGEGVTLHAVLPVPKLEREARLETRA
jgi:signal transduction histidine kinase